MKTDNDKIKLAFFRGVDFTCEIGASDWRIALSMPEFGYTTFVFGRGKVGEETKANVRLFSPQISRIHLWATLQINTAYLMEATKIRPDIIICDPGNFLAGGIYRLLHPQVRLILDVRSMPVETGRGGGYLLWYFDLAMRWPYYDAFSIITDGMLDELDAKYLIKKRFATVVWDSGYDDEIFHPLPPKSTLQCLPGLEDKFIVMFHGSLSPTRGLQDSIRGLRRLKDSGMPDVVIVFIGKGAGEAELRRLAIKENVEEQVVFIPPQPHCSIPHYLNCADLGMDPLPNHIWWQNQSALKVREYLAMGKPILATDLPCHRNISEAVLTVPDNSPAAFADGVIKYRALPQSERDRLRRVAIDDAKQFTWRARAKILAQFMRDTFSLGNAPHLN